MQKKREGWSIVLAGHWNRMIFTPEWVATHLFGQDDQIETVVALLPILPIIYRNDEVVVEISSARIICRARNLDNENSVRRSAAIAGIILAELPQTPVQGVGVNFAFREETPAAEILDLFAFADNPRWVDDGWEIGERKIWRQLTRDGVTLNLTVNLNGGRIDLDCNFHTSPDSNEAAIAAVDPDRVIQLQNTIVESLEVLYRLELEAEDAEL